METITDSNNTIYKDYTEKIKFKMDNEHIQPDDVNAFINLFNYSFKKKNNFFVPNFNKRLIKDIYLGYNTVKTNILTTEIKFIFSNLPMSQLKLFKFILSNFANNYDTIIEDNGDDLCIEKESIKNCILCLNKIMKEKK